MTDDRRKLAAEWRRAMRRNDGESASPILDSPFIRGGRSRVTYGDLGAIGGAIRKLGMGRSALIALAVFGWMLALWLLGNATGFPGSYGHHCNGYYCGKQFFYSYELLQRGGPAGIALFGAMWLPFAGVALLFIYVRRARMARRQKHTKSE